MEAGAARPPLSRERAWDACARGRRVAGPWAASRGETTLHAEHQWSHLRRHAAPWPAAQGARAAGRYSGALPRAEDHGAGGGEGPRHRQAGGPGPGAGQGGRVGWRAGREGAGGSGAGPPDGVGSRVALLAHSRHILGSATLLASVLRVSLPLPRRLQGVRGMIRGRPLDAKPMLLIDNVSGVVKPGEEGPRTAPPPTPGAPGLRLFRAGAAALLHVGALPSLVSCPAAHLVLWRRPLHSAVPRPMPAAPAQAASRCCWARRGAARRR